MSGSSSSGFAVVLLMRLDILLQVGYFASGWLCCHRHKKIAKKTEEERKKEKRGMNFEQRKKLLLGDSRDYIKCATCAKPGARKRCSACRGPWYCSRECQKANWAEHRETCKAMSRKIKMDEADFKDMLEKVGQEDDDDREPCPICFETLVDPVPLKCKHKMCFTCLEKLAASVLEANGGVFGPTRQFPCPLCREPVDIPLCMNYLKKAANHLQAQESYHQSSW